VARLLCDAGADKDKADCNGATPLMWASDQGHLEVARLLCDAGADKDKADHDGDTSNIIQIVPFLL
jgi:ankyrin repeat protein